MCAFNIPSGNGPFSPISSFIFIFTLRRFILFNVRSIYIRKQTVSCRMQPFPSNVERTDRTLLVYGKQEDSSWRIETAREADSKIDFIDH